MRKKIYRIALSIIAFSATPQLVQAKNLNVKEALSAIEKGGHIIYFRHFETSIDYPDQIKATVSECWTQRNISAAGFAQAQRIGKYFYSKNIPISRVIASPFCRAWQSAALAFGQKYEVIDGLKLPPAEKYDAAQLAEMKNGLLPFISSPPPAGQNLVIIAHDDNLPAAGGPDVKKQGEAVVLKPTGNGQFTVIGHIKPHQWPKVAK
jgi:hypothetical protein